MGFRTKTITPSVVGPSKSIPLEQANNLGLPAKAVVNGFWARVNEGQPTHKGKSLVSLEVWGNGFLSIKKKGASGIHTIIQNIPLLEISKRGIFLPPTPSTEIDWEYSYITVNNTGIPSMEKNTCFELVVLYSYQGDEAVPEKEGGRNISYKARRELLINSSQDEYILSQTNTWGLPIGAVIVGFKTGREKGTLTGKPLNFNAYNGTYLTLMKKEENFVDNFPISLLEEGRGEKLFPGMEYFPIPDVRVSELDWSGSKFKVKNISGVSTGEIVELTLYYYVP